MSHVRLCTIVTAALLQDFMLGPAEAQPTALRHNLPPGLQKRVEQGKPLPPGWAKKLQPGQILDRDIFDRGQIIGRSPDNEQITIRVDDEVIRIARATREILAILGR